MLRPGRMRPRKRGTGPVFCIADYTGRTPGAHRGAGVGPAPRTSTYRYTHLHTSQAHALPRKLLLRKHEAPFYRLQQIARQVCMESRLLAPPWGRLDVPQPVCNRHRASFWIERTHAGRAPGAHGGAGAGAAAGPEGGRLDVP